MARRIWPEVNTRIIAPKLGIIRLTNGLRIVSDIDIRIALYPDALIITGGPGWGEQIKGPAILEFIRRSGR